MAVRPALSDPRSSRPRRATAADATSPAPITLAGRQRSVGEAKGRRAMSPPVSQAARELAAQLQRQFGRDADLAKRLADAHQRLQRANDRVWSGLHPDALAVVYGEHPAVLDSAWVENRSEVLAAPDPLAAVQQVRWSIRSAFTDYEAAGEERRQLAADTGETIRQFVDALVADGWSAEQARNANVHELAVTNQQPPGGTNRWERH